ncbi:MAG: YbbR-like domain-containing protein [Fimbriimonas sp.]
MSEISERKINVPLLVASLIVSFFLWAAVYAQNLPVATRQVEVDLLPDGLDTARFAIVKRPDKLRVWVTGSEQQLNELRDMEKFGLVELSQSVAGARMYPVALQPNLLRELAHDAVPEVRLDIQPILRRKLKVSPQTSGRLSNKDLRLDSLVSEPGTVTVTGARPLVEQVVEARVAFDLGIADPKRAAPHNLVVEVVDARGVRVTGVEVSPPIVGITPVLVPSPEEKTASVLTRFRGSPAPGYEQAGYRLDRETVTLMGPSFALATVSAIETQPIDISGLTGSKEFTTPLKLPTGVTATRPTQVRVRVLIRRVPTPTTPPPPTPAPETKAPAGVTP